MNSGWNAATRSLLCRDQRDIIRASAVYDYDLLVFRHLVTKLCQVRTRARVCRLYGHGHNSSLDVYRNTVHCRRPDGQGWLGGAGHLTLWLTGARKEAQPTDARPVEPRVRPGRVRCRARAYSCPTISTETSTAGIVPLFSSQCVVSLSSGQPTPGP